MTYDHNKYFEQFKFQSGYRELYLNSPKGYSRKIINAQTGNNNLLSVIKICYILIYEMKLYI